MTNKRYPALIGGFVLGAIFLLFIFLLLLGGQGLFTAKVKYHLYFDKSVKGLSKGAPVMLRGVRIGQVSDICLASRGDADLQETLSWPIQVTVDIVPASLELGQPKFSLEGTTMREWSRTSWQQLKKKQQVEEWIKKMVLQEGLRAQLQTISLLTGQLYIELNFFSDDAPGPELEQELAQHIIPTRMSAFERLFLSLSQKEFGDQLDGFHMATAALGRFIKSGQADQMLGNLYQITSNVKHLSGNLNMTLPLITGVAYEMINNLNQLSLKLDAATPELLADAQQSLKTWNEALPQLTQKVNETLINLNTLLAKLDNVADLEEGPSAELLDDARLTLATAQKVMVDLSGFVQQAQSTLSSEAPAQQSLQRTLAEIEATAQSFRALAELLQRRPEAMIRGK